MKIKFFRVSSLNNYISDRSTGPNDSVTLYNNDDKIIRSPIYEQIWFPIWESSIINK